MNAAKQVVDLQQDLNRLRARRGSLSPSEEEQLATLEKLQRLMGETAAALRIADAAAQGSDVADMAYLYAGDACRVAGQTEKAEAGYRSAVQRYPSFLRAWSHWPMTRRKERAEKL